MSRRMIGIPFRAMGCDCRVAVTVDDAAAAGAIGALAAGRAEVRDCEMALSRFRPDSDLSRVNAAAGEWVEVGPRMVGATTAALRARALTRGRFDPTILAPLVAAGYDGDYAGLDRRRPPASVPAGWRRGGAVQVDAPAGRVRVGRGVGLDLGGIAKGWSAGAVLERVRRGLPSAHGVLVDLGGDLAVWGVPPRGGAWRIDVNDPRHPGEVLTTLEVTEGGIATSGRDRRVLGPDGAGHHLIDPRTGVPATGGPLAVTVIAADAATAEAHATLLAMAGPRAAREHLLRHPEIGAVIVPERGPVWMARSDLRAGRAEVAA